jgi:hypothetical protein
VGHARDSYPSALSCADVRLTAAWEESTGRSRELQISFRQTWLGDVRADVLMDGEGSVQ